MTTKILTKPASMWVGVLAFALTVLLPGLGSSRVLTYHEVCFAQPAREMLAGNGWLIPSIAGELFPDKPPMTHWILAGSMWLFGVNEFAARLPLALSGALLAVLAADLGRRFFGSAVGWAAGTMQATSFYVLMQARLAECDMLLALFVALSVATFSLVEFGQLPRQRRFVLTVHACAVFAFLCKGPLGLVFIGGSAITLVALLGSWSRLRFWFHPWGLAVSLGGTLAWPLAAYASHPEILDGWRRHNLERFSGGMGNGGPAWFYLAMIPILVLPWTPWAVHGWMSRTGLDSNSWRHARCLTIAWMIPGVFVLSMAAWKHKHYAIPLLLPMSIWAGRGLVSWLQTKPRFSWKKSRPWICWGLILTALGVSVLTSFGMIAIPSLALLGLMLFSVTEFRDRGRPIHAGISLMGTTAVLVIWLLISGMPRFDSYRTQYQFAAKVHQELGKDESLFVPLIPAVPGSPLALPENQITFYLPMRLKVIDKHTLPRKPSLILAPKRYSNELSKFGSWRAIDECPKRGLMKSGDQLTLFRVTPHMNVSAN